MGLGLGPGRICCTSRLERVSRRPPAWPLPKKWRASSAHAGRGAATFSSARALRRCGAVLCSAAAWSGLGLGLGLGLGVGVGFGFGFGFGVGLGLGLRLVLGLPRRCV